jgi:hypothetical protein
MAMRLLGALLAAALIGCEANQPPEEASEYDPNVDAPPTNLVVQADENLLADQAKLADEATRLAATATPKKGTAAGGAKEDARVTQVRGVMEKMIEAGKTGQLSGILPNFSDADANAMKDVVTALAELSKAKKDLQKVADNMLGMKQLPALVSQALSAGADGGPILASLGDLATDMLDYKIDANSITVTGAGTPLKFTRATGDQANWQIQLTDAEKDMYQVLAELARVQTNFAKKLSGDIQDGAVTENNLDKTAMDMMEKQIKPALDRLNESRANVKGAKSAPAATDEGGSGEAP